ncbi:MAG: tetratricopeptide repeat protein [Bacteroidales bacterium]|nr:tetratricopeptide repeat protein [Bacteroidales bacterium]
MKACRYYIVLLGLLILFISSCGKKIVPAMMTGRHGNNYDAAAFNYVYVEAIKQKLMGNGGEALKYLEQCIKINSESDAAYYQMAQIVLSNGDIKNGKKYAVRALSIDKENIWYLMMLAGMYYKERNLDSAIIYYEKAVKNNPDKENLKLALGNLYSENSNFEKAKIIFDSFDKKYGVNESSTLSAIKSLMSAKKYDEALVKVQLLLKEYPDELLYNGLLAEIYRGNGQNEKAQEVYDQILGKTLDNPQTQLSLCDFLITEKRYDELFLLLNTVILNNKVTREDKISLLARLIELPEIIKDKGNELIIGIMVLEANYKEDDIIPLLRPELMIRQSKLIDASLRLEEIIKTKPENYYAWEKLLLVYLQLGDYIKLMIKGEECATRFNISFLAKVLYANGALENGKYSIALEELKKAEILAGDNKDSIIQVLTMRADVYYRMKNYTKAFEIFEEAIKSNSEELTVLNNYAYYLAEQNMKLKEAEEMAKKVIEKEKGNTTYLDTYAWVLYKRGKLNEADKIMEAIINSGEKPDAEWYEHYGFILKKQKKCVKAIENWSIAIKIDSTKTNLIKEIENCGR